MKQLTLSVITMLIMVLSVGDIHAQDKKVERKAKQEQRQVQENIEFSDVIKSEHFRFIVSTIDADFAPQLAYMQLRGGYFITYRNGELTVLLPFSGPNKHLGNTPSYNELSFTTAECTIAIAPNADNTMSATIEAKDPQSNYAYTFVISNMNNRENLTVYATGIDRVKYFGGLNMIKE